MKTVYPFRGYRMIIRHGSAAIAGSVFLLLIPVLLMGAAAQNQEAGQSSEMEPGVRRMAERLAQWEATFGSRNPYRNVQLIRTFVPQLIARTAPRVAQDPRQASSWPKRTPADGVIDWDTRASYLHDWVRAQTRPYPGAFTYAGDERLVVWRARPIDLDGGVSAGTVVERRAEGVVVACGEGGLLLEEVEPEAALDRLPVGARLG